MFDYCALDKVEISLANRLLVLSKALKKVPGTIFYSERPNMGQLWHEYSGSACS